MQRCFVVPVVADVVVVVVVAVVAVAVAVAVVVVEGFFFWACVGLLAALR